MMLVRLGYTLATEEAERVGVDHVARVAAHHTTHNSNGKLHITIAIRGFNRSIIKCFS